MPSWWEKFSSKDLRKKANKEGFIDTIQRKFKSASEEKCNTRSGGSWRRCSDTVSDRGSRSRVPSRSQSPTTQVSRCQSFAERSHAQPLPLPGAHLPSIGHTNSGITASPKPGFERGSEQLILPHPRPRHGSYRPDPTDTEVDIAAASISSDSTICSDDPSDSRLLSSLTSDYENGYKTTLKSPSSVMHKDQYPVANEKNSRKILKPANVLFNNQILSTSPKRRPLGTHVQNLQIPPHKAFGSNPDSSLSSPSRSPMRAFGSEQVMSCSYWAGKYYPEIASGQCSSPGSGYNSGHNSVGGDWSGQLLWPHSRCSPECSPIPSPRMASPGPSSRIHSGAVTPLHPRAGAAAIDSPTTRPDDGKQQSHCLPLPPLTISNSRPFSPTYSAATTPSVPRSPGRAENPTSSGSRWQKGRLLGRGTCGHVYLGFNRESGEMCAMKEVTLFSDDPKSKESAQQLGQEIQLLSRLRHPNIVQYYGSETVDDTLYIYLEYVSGGSIYKLLQEYGQFGEIAIRSYTQQILSGLAYLHAKNTVHRDIKGANILVDPSGKVKLADFGMAKHITGQSCPLSFKGSPHWMAPELFKNSSGCHLAVDIWSLGCTVIEMATTKPPWSQFEGVAALFKIGNSRELPPIPDHLSEEGKDFVRRCLQRDPSHRPTAAQLLEHPFVKNAAPLERSVLSADPSDALLSVTSAVRSVGIGNAQSSSGLDSGVRNYHNRGSKAGSGSSDAHALRNISCSVSPGSPILHSRSSPSPISSPHTTSGSSTPLTGGSGAIPFHHPQQPITYAHEGVAMIQRSQNSFYANGSTPFYEPKPDLFRGMSQASHAFHGISSSDNGALGDQPGRPFRGDARELYDKQLVLADHVSQQLLREHLKQSSSLELKPSSLMLGHNKAI